MVSNQQLTWILLSDDDKLQNLRPNNSGGHVQQLCFVVPTEICWITTLQTVLAVFGQG